MIPDDHPRAKSLHYRHKLVEGMHAKVVTPSGLTAHGRGEAFDYLMGEKTLPSAEKAAEIAVCAMLTAKHPIISINGNVAALNPEDFVELSRITGAKLEINLFYQAPGRIEAIEKVLREAGATEILGLGDVESATISELSSNRRIVDPRGIYQADVVMVPLEDGDRTEALVQQGKLVIAVDLNPLSRTAMHAHITLIDNVVRCIPVMISKAKAMKAELEKNTLQYETLKAKVDNYINKDTLKESIKSMIEYLSSRIDF
ncbi:hypothetical protein ES708_08996 [subsurface metagenome]